MSIIHDIAFECQIERNSPPVKRLIFFEVLTILYIDENHEMVEIAFPDPLL